MGNNIISFFACLFFMSLLIMPMNQQCCQFVRVIEETMYEDGPFVSLDVARMSGVFRKMQQVFPNQEKYTLSFYDTDIKMVEKFAQLLKRQHAVDGKNTIKSLGKRSVSIEGLSVREHIELCNLAQAYSADTLREFLFNVLYNQEIGRQLLPLINPEIKKRLAKLSITRQRQDQKLLERYSEKLRSKEQVIENEGILVKLCAFTRKRICYYDALSNLLVSTIKSNTLFKNDRAIKAFCISSYDPIQRYSTTLLWLKQKIWGCPKEVLIDASVFNMQKIYSICMNEEQTEFICHISHGVQDVYSRFKVDIPNKIIIPIAPADTQNFLKTDAPFGLYSAGRGKHKIWSNATNHSGWDFNSEYRAKDILMTNEQSIVRKKKSGYNRKHIETSIVRCVDSVMESFTRHLTNNEVPYVVSTIAEQPFGVVALSDEEMIEYDNMPESCRQLIDASYVVTRNSRLCIIKGYCIIGGKKILSLVRAAMPLFGSCVLFILLRLCVSGSGKVLIDGLFSMSDL